MIKPREKLICLIAVVLFVVALLGFCVSFWHYSPYWLGLEKKTFYVSANITERESGFDLNATALTFGKIGLGNSASRNIMLSNSYDFPVVAKVSSEGKISQILTYEKEVYAEGGDTLKIGFSVIGSRNTSLGFYDGYVTIKVVPAF